MRKVNYVIGNYATTSYEKAKVISKKTGTSIKTELVEIEKEKPAPTLYARERFGL